MGYRQQVYDKEKLHVNVARMKKGGHNFEVILDDVDAAVDFKHGANIRIRDIINGDKVFKDANKGEVASEELMEQWFETNDTFKVAEILIKKGEINLNTEQRNKLFENRKRRVMEYIHKNAFDPKTKLPHPMQRIELAIKEAKVSIDPMDRFDFQIKQIVSKLQPIIPLSFEKLRIRVVIQAKHAGSAYSTVKSKYDLEKEDWRNDGSVQFEMQIVAGVKNDIYSLLNKMTNGEVEIKEIK